MKLHRHTVSMLAGTVLVVLWGAIVSLTTILARPSWAQEHDAASQLPSIQYLYEAIEVRGNDKTNQRFFEALLGFDAGDVVHVEQLDRYRRALMATGFFADVQTRLAEGTQPDTVIVVVDVEEQNTIVFDEIFFGASADTTLWGGLDLAETNLFGTGMLFGGAFVASGDQAALRVDLSDPFATLLPLGWRVQFLYTDERNEGPGINNRGVPSEETFVLNRIGGLIGLAYSPGQLFDVRLDYRLESLDLGFVEPNQVRPDVGIEPGNTLHSVLSLELAFDRRNHPGLPTEGPDVRLIGTVSADWLASDYDYFRLDGSASYAFPLWSGQTLRLAARSSAVFAGAHTPYFVGDYVGDITVLVPEADLGLQFTDRRPLDFLNNGASLVNWTDLMASIEVEWAVPIYWAFDGRYRVELFVGTGLFAVRQGPWEIGRRPNRVVDDPDIDLESATDLHFDLEFDIGVRADTPVGLFTFSVGSAIGHAPLN